MQAKPLLEWRPQARIDLLEIVAYIADDNPDAAQELKDEIECYVRQFLRRIVPHSASEKVLKRGQGRTAFLQFGEAYP